jgi:ADP-heptose:LPS heptosyltransferase
LADEVRVWPDFGDSRNDLSLVSRISKGRDFVEGLRQERFDRVVVLNHHGTGITLARHLGVPVSGFDKLFDRKKEDGDREALEGWPGYLVASSRGIRALNRIHLSDMWRGFGLKGGTRPHSGSAGEPAGRNPHGPVVVVLGGRSPYRRWEREHLSRLIGSLRRIDGGPVLLSGGPEDAALGDLLAGECGEGVSNMAGKTDHAGIADLLASAGVVVSPDTAPLHLAASMGTPTVGLFFASALPFETGAYRAGSLTLVSSMDCYPCSGEGSSCPHRSCRNDPDPAVVAEIVSSVKRGAQGKDLVRDLWGKLPGSELWEAQWTLSGLQEKILTPRALTRERMLARLLRRFYWRYLEGAVCLTDLGTELSWEGMDILQELAAPADGKRTGLPWTVWFRRLEQGVELYAGMRERALQRFERNKMVDRLAVEFPMIWPLLHHLEWVEGGRGSLERLLPAASQLSMEASEAARLVADGGPGAESAKNGRVHVAV